MKVMPLKTRHQATLAWWVVCILLAVLFLLPLYLIGDASLQEPGRGRGHTPYPVAT